MEMNKVPMKGSQRNDSDEDIGMRFMYHHHTYNISLIEVMTECGEN